MNLSSRRETFGDSNSEKLQDVCFLALSLILVDLSRFEGRNRYIWTWGNYQILKKTLMSEENKKNRIQKNHMLTRVCFLFYVCKPGHGVCFELTFND